MKLFYTFNDNEVSCLDGSIKCLDMFNNCSKKLAVYIGNPTVIIPTYITDKWKELNVDS